MRTSFLTELFQYQAFEKARPTVGANQKTLLWYLFALVFAFHTPTTLAQNAGGLEIASVEGAIDGVYGDRVEVTTETGDKYIAVLGRKASVRFSGTADKKFLRPGLMVRFEADFDVKQATATQPVSKLEIFRPITTGRLTQEQRRDQTPGVYPAANKDTQPQGRNNNPRSQQTGRNNGNRRGRNQQANSSSRFRVVGQIRALQADKVQVVAGRMPVMIQLANELEISVKSADMLFSSDGDKVKVTGLRNSAQPKFIQTETMQIESAKPLGADLDAGKTDAKQDPQQGASKKRRRGELGK
ncbi:MAG: hypothetical protein AAGG44_03990 [Planctomycetota bacterium]